MAELTQIHSTTSPNAINIVFVHGLGGDSRETWMHKPKDDATLWPRWIGEDADCNVWILGYDAALSGWTGSAMHLADQGIAFMSELLFEQALRGQPLVLVGHSLGGLVIKSGMVLAETLGDPRFQPLLAAIIGVVFIATPHQGSSLATIAALLSGLLRTNAQVANMRLDDAWLKTLNGQFRALQAQRGFRVTAFFETRGVLLGRKFLGISFGTRLLVVDRNSSDPQIPQVVPTPVDADHREIAKPANRRATIHKALLELVAGLAGKSLLLSVEETSRSSPPDNGAVRQALHRASSPLFSWPSTLPGGAWLERPELEELTLDIDNAESSLSLLLGEPGSGKSALLTRLAQRKYADGWPVLAIKADRLPEDLLDIEGLARFLAIGNDTASSVRQLAREGPVLVLVDQLDAMAELVVQHSARLRVLLDLIRDLSGTPNVHIVTSCRTFEHRHDPSLRNLEATAITLNLPEWDAVELVLLERGVTTENWNVELKAVLRSPHALDLFLTLLQSATELEVLRSFQGMLQLQWETHILADRTGRRRQIMLGLARKMAEREVLGLPLSAVEEWFQDIEQLTAVGLLRFDEGSGRVEFRHQTLYEFVRARSFLDEAGSLTESVLRNQANLRIRPQLWHALAFFRKASPEDYGTELVQLWSAALRPHLKMLVIEFLGKQESPLPAEIQLVFHALEDLWFRPRFLSAAIGSPGWLAALANAHLPVLMARPVDEARGIVPLLENALSLDPNLVIELIRRYWLPDPSKDELSWRVLGLGSVAPQSSAWVDDLVAIASRTAFAEWTLDSVAAVISVAMPDEAPRLVAAWLRRQISEVKATLEDVQATDLDRSVESREQIQAILEARQFHVLPAVAEAAPQVFVRMVWPSFAEGVAMCAGREHAFLVGFRNTTGLISLEMDDEEDRIDRPLLEGMWRAVQVWGRTHPESFFEFVDSVSGSGLLVLERLLAKGVEQCAASLPARTLAYLQSDPRRLVLGPYSDVHKESVAIIRALSQHLDELQFVALADLISGWQRYRAQPEGEDASTRQQRLRWARQHRLRLLRALPRDRCSPVLQKHIEEEERAFPGLGDEDIRFSGVRSIESPVSAAQMARSKDEDVLNLFSELDDESGWDHPRDMMKGGAIQAARELATLAKTDLAKVLRIVRALRPGTNEIPVGTAIRELVSAGLPVAELFALIEELHEKGFASDGFRREAAAAVASATSAQASPPDSLLVLMESWLVPLESTDEEDFEISDAQSIESILWGHGGLSALPNGNFPILAALTEACLKKEPVEVDRWMEILERHVSTAESTRVWQAMAWRYFSKLRLAKRARAESFLDALFDAYPALLQTRDGVILIANTFRWASASMVQKWLNLMETAGLNSQGWGELALLRHAQFPAEGWSRELVTAELARDGVETSARRVGIAYASVHLWDVPLTRLVVHPYLLQLTASAEDQVLKAIDELFLGGGFVADPATREMLDALAKNSNLLTQPHAERLPEILEGMVAIEPERVCRVANVILDVAGEKMGSMATSWYLSTEWLLAIALRLQDLGEVHRHSGSVLLERMLEFNLPQAREMTLDLDKRTPVTGATRPPRRSRTVRKSRRRSS